MGLEDPPTRQELEAEELTPRSPLDGMTPCPHGCGAHFHGESVAYVRHLEDRRRNGGACPDPWA